MLSVRVVILPFAYFLLHLALVCSQGSKDWDLNVDYKDNGRTRHLSVDGNKKFGNFNLGGSYKTDFSRYKGTLSGSYKDRDSGFGAGIGVGTDGSNWKGSLGATKSWEIGGGQLKASGRVDTSGGWSVGLSGGWRFKRRRRSLEKSICKSCIFVDVVKSPKELQQYENSGDVDFAMTAKFDKLSYNSSLTELDFKIVDILQEVPINFDFKQAKFINIYANHGVCAISCLKGIVPGEYLITGKMFKGQLVIHGKFLLLRLPKDQNQKTTVF